jgi:hypothetical protein
MTFLRWRPPLMKCQHKTVDHRDVVCPSNAASSGCAVGALIVPEGGLRGNQT